MTTKTAATVPATRPAPKPKASRSKKAAPVATPEVVVDVAPLEDEAPVAPIAPAPVEPAGEDFDAILAASEAKLVADTALLHGEEAAAALAADLEIAPAPVAPLATPEEAAQIEDAFKAEDAAMGAPLLADAGEETPTVIAPEDVPVFVGASPDADAGEDGPALPAEQQFSILDGYLANVRYLDVPVTAMTKTQHNRQQIDFDSTYRDAQSRKETADEATRAALDGVMTALRQMRRERDAAFIALRRNRSGEGEAAPVDVPAPVILPNAGKAAKAAPKAKPAPAAKVKLVAEPGSPVVVTARLRAGEAGTVAAVKVVGASTWALVTFPDQGFAWKVVGALRVTGPAGEVPAVPAEAPLSPPARGAGAPPAAKAPKAQKPAPGAVTLTQVLAFIAQASATDLLAVAGETAHRSGVINQD